MLSEKAQAWIETLKAKQARKESLYESEQVILELADALVASRRTLRDEFAMALVSNSAVDISFIWARAATLLAALEARAGLGKWEESK